jgi:hypothetical protein
MQKFKVSQPHFTIYKSQSKWWLQLNYVETFINSRGHGITLGSYDTWPEALGVCKLKQQGTLEELLDDYWR